MFFRLAQVPDHDFFLVLVLCAFLCRILYSNKQAGPPGDLMALDESCTHKRFTLCDICYMLISSAFEVVTVRLLLRIFACNVCGETWNLY